MPEFLDLYVQDLSSKAKWIREAYSQVGSRLTTKYLKDAFYEYWVSRKLPKASPNEFEILAVDSSSRHYITGNGGIFYVVRALAISSIDIKYRKVHVGFDYSPSEKYSEVISRMMEWLEHEVILEALNNGFKGYVLIDGSIYGRLAHVPLEMELAYNKGFMIKYFETLIKLLNVAKKKNVPLIGISKESRASFFREFLIRGIVLKLAKEFGIDESKIIFLLAMALDKKRKVIDIMEEMPDIIRELMKEYITRKPDFQLIMNYAKAPGYSMPLLLSAPARTKRAFKLINSNPEKYLRSAFPLLSTDENFVRYALNIIKELLKLPSIISFHVLPQDNDTPMRVDVPTWVFGIERRLSEISFTETVDINVDKILKIISAGYCGLENYNIWLTAVDKQVKLRRNVFENIYLPKFEEIIGRTATSRGYRRVRFP